MIEKKRTQDNKKEILRFQKIAQKQKLQEAGITLIALVVTIIILLILAGVTLNMALSDNGLIKKSQEATEKYRQAQNKEEESISDIAKQLYSEYVGEKVTGYEPEEITIEGEETLLSEDTTGTNTNTEFETEDLGWRIWDYDGETLRLVSERPTTNTLNLKGATGYNNGVHLINEICKKYYTDKDIPGVEVRGLRKSDIEKVSSYDYTKFKYGPDNYLEIKENNDAEGVIHFGESFGTKELNINKQCPVIYQQKDVNWNYKYDNETKKGIGDPGCSIPWEQEVWDNTKGMESSEPDDIEFKVSYYNHDYESSEFISSRYFDIIFNDMDEKLLPSYWLAGRFSAFLNDTCFFGLDFVDNRNNNFVVSGNDVFTSDRRTI